MKTLNKLRNKKGFTLMEMLIVVAIIAILVAIAIPAFNNALTKARESADMANIRAWYAEEVLEVMLENKKEVGAYDGPLNYGGDDDSKLKETGTDPYQVTYTPSEGEPLVLTFPDGVTKAAAAGG